MTAGPQRSASVLLLQCLALALFLIPSNAVFKVVGANGYVASLIGLACFLIWILNWTLGFHDPLKHRNPVQGVFALFWASTFASYLILVIDGTDSVRQLASERWILQLLMITGVALVASEGLRTVQEIGDVIDAIAWGATGCVAIACAQRWLHFDLSPMLGSLPGLSQNSEATAFTPRYGLVRVAGTAMSPIEFGVVCGMVLPLAAWRTIVRSEIPRWRRWLPTVMCLLGAVISVSRSGLLSLVVAVAILVVLLPVKERAAALLTIPVAAGFIFAAVPGFFATMTAYIGGASTDPSVTTRTDDYSFAFKFVYEQPWLGHGPGWYQFRNALEILDNQYLESAINLGVVGVIASVALLAGPGLVGLRFRRMSDDPGLQLLGAALAAASFAAAICSMGFDSMSFPMFVGMVGLVAGLAGAGWLIARRRQVAVAEADDRTHPQGVTPS